MENLILVFLKVPRAGVVKTRLGRVIGAEAAAALYRRMVETVLGRLPSATAVRLVHAPDDGEEELREWLGRVPGLEERVYEYRPQGPGGLGERLEAAFGEAFSEGWRRVAAIGTDCLEMDGGHFERTWALLGAGVDVVLGPAVDGGYYLVALGSHRPELFRGIPWSTERTLAATLRRAAELGLTTAPLDLLRDIDTVDDLEAMADRWRWDRRTEAAPNRLAMEPLPTTPSLGEPIVFKPIPQERVWGGRRLEVELGRALPMADRSYGESWEVVDREEAQSVVAAGSLSGITLHDLWTRRRHEIFGAQAPDTPRFPLLVKILDARERLSIQVHPPAEAAARLGGEPKTEAWFVAAADPGAMLHVGLRTGVDRAAFEQSLADGTAARLVHTIPVSAGDFIFIPSGRIHAIGDGLLIYEIQQNSDTTYRVFDWNRVGTDGRPRELHVEQSLECIDFDDIEPGMGVASGECLVTCPYFRLERWDLAAACGDGGERVGASPPSRRRAAAAGEFAIFGVVSGRVLCRGRSFRPGDFFLVPAGREGGSEHGDWEIGNADPESGATLLRITWGSGVR